MITELGTENLSGDALRVHRATEHCRRVVQGCLSVHAVAMARGQHGVLLFGGHGAGKSVTGLALAARGWHVLAGDVALVHAAGQADRLALVGGTRRFLLRPTSASVPGVRPASSWEQTPGPTARIDATDRLTWVALGSDAIEAHLAVNVTVDSGAGTSANLAALDAHTSQSVWWRASGYLLDRVLDDPSAEPLRCMERPALVAVRMGLARSAARLVPVHEGFGTADGIAEAIENELMGELV